MPPQHLLQPLDGLGIVTLVPGHQGEVVVGRELFGLQPEALAEPRGRFIQVALHV